MNSHRDEFYLKKTLPCYFSTQFWHFIALLPQNPDFSFFGNLWEKSLPPGKKWGTSECLSANLQTGNQTRFPINLKAMKHTIFQRFFKSKRGKWGRKTIFIITSLHPCYSVLLHVENHETDESDITGHSATRHPVSGSAWKSGVPVWDDTFHDSF